MANTGAVRSTQPRPSVPSQAPNPSGYLLAAIERGANEELRLVLDEYEGHQYLAARVWRVDRSGAWWPVKGKGVSIRLGELAEVIDALQLAADIVGVDLAEL